MKSKRYEDTIGEYVPSTFHRQTEDEKFESDVLKALEPYTKHGFKQAESEFSHYDFDFTPRIKLETKQRGRRFYDFKTQFVPVSKLPALVDAYEKGEYNTLYLVRDKEHRLFSFWVSEYTSKQLKKMPTYLNPDEDAEYRSRVFLIPVSVFTEVESLEKVALILLCGGR